MIYPLDMMISHCYVQLPEGTHCPNLSIPIGAKVIGGSYFALEISCFDCLWTFLPSHAHENTPRSLEFSRNYGIEGTYTLWLWLTYVKSPEVISEGNKNMDCFGCLEWNQKRVSFSARTEDHEVEASKKARAALIAAVTHALLEVWSSYWCEMSCCVFFEPPMLVHSYRICFV